MISKRTRTSWSDAEIEILVACFKKNQKPNSDVILNLIEYLSRGRTEKQVKTWFMNQRQKAKRVKRDMQAFRNESLKYDSSNPRRSFSSSSLMPPNQMPAVRSYQIQFQPIGVPLMPNQSSFFQNYFPSYPFLPFPPFCYPLPGPVPDQILEFSESDDPDSDVTFIPDPIIDQ